MKGSIGTSMTYYTIYKKVDDINYYPKEPVIKTKAQKKRAHRINQNKVKCRRCFYFNEVGKMCNYSRKDIP